MPLFPSTDIVLDVANRAAPQSRASALQGLARAQATKPAVGSGVEFRSTARVCDETWIASTVQPSKAPTESDQAARKFEAFLLSSWLETLLPREDSAFFGSSSGGGVWRSMMAEQLGDVFAKSGAFHMQEMISQRSNGTRGA